MRIAIASGKGGSGKTSFSVLLAYYLRNKLKHPVKYLDCDCEAPNGHLFFDVDFKGSRSVEVECPDIDESLCDYCGLCRDICKFSAITVFGKSIMTFPDMCHSCGGCFRVCPNGAINKQSRMIGEIRWGESRKVEGLSFVQGSLRIGEAMSPPLIKEVLNTRFWNEPGTVEIVDSPPGTSCPVVTSIKDADYVILIGESTPFGLHDLKIMATVARKIGVPFGVIANKAREKTEPIGNWCSASGVEFLGSLPFSMEFARAYAGGGDIFEIMEEEKDSQELLWHVAKMVK